jgi:hypothetical protein
MRRSSESGRPLGTRPSSMMPTPTGTPSGTASRTKRSGPPLPFKANHDRRG